MRYTSLPPAFHKANRRKFAATMGDDAIAIIDTNDVLMRSNDVEVPFRPDSNFYYLTGIDQPDAVLVLVPGHSNPDLRELLFVRETSDVMALWQGESFSREQAAAISGVTGVFWTGELKAILGRLLPKYPVVYSNAVESATPAQSYPANRRIEAMRAAAPLHQYRSALPQLSAQRVIKDPVEIAQLSRAVDATKLGILAAWRALGPGVREYELEAELIAGYLRAGTSGHGFNPIVASGPAATVLHYDKNDRVIEHDDLVLIDTGAEVGWYSADVSRVAPASGKFAGRQGAVYEAVMRVQNVVLPLHKPGSSIAEIEKQRQNLLLDELVGLKLITPEQRAGKKSLELLRKYYAHTSHHMGLDVHDVGEHGTLFEPGMVVSCEPGLYLAEEGIGVRIEDVVVITQSGCDVLSKAIPTDPAAIEPLVGRAS